MLRSAATAAVRRCRVSSSAASLPSASSTCSSITTRSTVRPSSMLFVAQRINTCRSVSSTSPQLSGDDVPSKKPSMYAAVDHGDAYDEAIAGRHGQQLKLAYDEGKGKDDPPYDPFALLLPDEDEDVDDDMIDGEEDVEVEEGETDASGAAAALDEPLEDDGDLDDTAEDEEDYSDDDSGDHEAAEQKKYTGKGFIRRPKSQLAALKSGLPAGGLFAVLALPGTQQKVTVDDVIVVNKLKPVDKWAVGKTITLKDEDVLLVGSTHLTLVGLPGVSGVEVDVLVEEITRDAKVLVFKKRKRKHSRRLNGFRREVTMLRVLDIRLPEKYANSEYKEMV